MTARSSSPKTALLLLAAAAASSLLGAVPGRTAEHLQLPTDNQALYQPDGGPRFFVGTAGKPWTSGAFGCVRSEGWQHHEGLDIRCLQRDARGEPTDPVRAAAAGTVAYVSRQPGLSNFGNYLVLSHRIDGLDVHTLYAHLAAIRPQLKPGTTVQAGETLATMGRTSNTRQAISKDRAHVHFEIDLLASRGFIPWYRKTFPGQRNDHQLWNGQNLIGIDPRALLLEQRRLGPRFNLPQFVRNHAEMFRVRFHGPRLGWAARHPLLVDSNPIAAREGPVAHDVLFAYTGLPFRVIPRAQSELSSRSRSSGVELLSVQAAEHQRHPCRKLVSQSAGKWRLAPNGERLISLLRSDP